MVIKLPQRTEREAESTPRGKLRRELYAGDSPILSIATRNKVTTMLPTENAATNALIMVIACIMMHFSRLGTSA